MRKKKRHAIIIGAGVAGLTAAYYLLTKTDIRPIVLEKENYIGGLARTFDFDGDKLDIGGHRFFSNNDEILAMLQKFLTVQESPKELEEIFYREKFFRYPVTMNFDMIKKLGPGESFSIMIDYLKARYGRHEKITLGDFIGERLFLGDKNSGMRFETPTSEKIFYPETCCGQFCEALAEEIKKLGGEVLLLSAVKSFHVDQNKIVRSVKVENAAGLLTFPAEYFLSSMPLAELANALDDGLSFQPFQIARGLLYHDLIVGMLRVEKPFAQKLIRRIYISEPSLKLTRLQIFDNRLSLEYICKEDDELWQMSEDDFIKFATEEIVSLGIVDIKDVRAGMQIKIPKAYPVSENISELCNALDEIQNLYCIGRNGQHSCNNMATSMLTAIAAMCAIAGKFPKSDVWKIK